MNNAFANMKDSGVEWIGKIPEHWELSKMKRVLRNASIKGHPEAQVLSLYREYGVIPKDSRDDNHNVTSEDTASYKYVENGDLVINKMKAWQGSLGLSQYEGIVSPAYYVCKFISNRISRKFLHHLIRSKAYAQEFERLSTGMRVGQWDLGIDDFLRVPLLLPPFPEQEAIAAYLDEKCTAIDDIITEAKASIEEYKAWKASVIFEAVTKGLNPNAEMKDSGVEWIGKIPINAEVIKLKYLIHGYKAGPFGSSLITGNLLTEGSILVYTPEHIAKKTVLTDKNLFLPIERKMEMSQFFVEPGDIIFPIVGSLGRAMQISSDMPSGIINQRLAKFRLNEEKVDSVYFMWLFANSSFYSTYIDRYQRGSIIVNLTKSIIGEMPFVLPCLPTQRKIATYLDEKCAAIDGIIAEKETLITELETYKKSLIFETVTGKRRVC